MEFEFQKSACPCLETVLREVQNVEQTQEIKLPDGMPGGRPSSGGRNGAATASPFPAG